MKIAFVINRIASEQSNFTTTRLAWRAANAGHAVALIELGDFIYNGAGVLQARAISPARSDYASDAEYLAEVQHPDAHRDVITVTEQDVLLLRSNPAEEMFTRGWAVSSDLLFAQIAAARGVMVLNDATHLTNAVNKTYFLQFPECVRPRTLISRDAGDVKAFIEQMGGHAVIKPLQGYGGKGVFVVRPEHRPNLNQMIEAVIRDGYVLAQEYLPEAADGDLRLLLLNGRPLRVNGSWACFRRRSSDGDSRSNISAGGTVEAAPPDAAALRLAEIVGPKLSQDGMYLAGLDVAGDKLMEINVHSSGGLNVVEDLMGVPFCDHVIGDLERKVRLRDHYAGSIDHAFLATW